MHDKRQSTVATRWSTWLYYSDRSYDNKVKELTVKAKEFIRRYLLHILPPGFMKIRYYGFLAHANKKASIPLLRQLINPDAEIAERLMETVEEMMLRLTGIGVSLYPECGKGKMAHIEDLPNLPPSFIQLPKDAVALSCYIFERHRF